MNYRPGPSGVSNLRGGGAQNLMEQQVSQFKSLTESSRWKPLLNVGGGIKDNWKKMTTAVLLENAYAYHENLDETTKTYSIGTFDKYAFPLIRTIFPNLIATELVSVQPMTGPASLIFYFDFVYGLSKGQISAGQKVVGSAMTPGPFQSSYTSEIVSNETITSATTTTNTPITGSLSFTPVRAGTVTFTDGILVITDDGNGGLTGDTGSGGTLTINYVTGAFSMSFSSGTASTGVNSTYEYDSESSQAEQIPELDILLTSSPVTAKPRKLRARWSLESSNNMRALYGLDSETELVTAIAEQIKFEIDREVIEDLLNIAQGTVPTFDQTTPSGISFTEHKLHFIDKLVEGNNIIFSATRRATANWVVAGVNVCNIVETLPGFKALPENTSMGVRHIGNLNGRWEFYKDPYMSTNTYMMGYRGSSFLDTGYVYAPYIPLYATPTVTLDDFVARKGLATQYGKKAISGRFYATGAITGTTGGY